LLLSGITYGLSKFSTNSASQKPHLCTCLEPSLGSLSWCLGLKSVKIIINFFFFKKKCKMKRRRNFNEPTQLHCLACLEFALTQYSLA